MGTKQEKIIVRHITLEDLNKKIKRNTQSCNKGWVDF